MEQTTNTRKELSRFGYEIRTIEELKKISKQLNRLDCLDCNGEITERQEKRRVKLELKSAELAKEIGYLIYRQSDPRGCSLYLITKDIPENSYNHGIAL